VEHLAEKKKLEEDENQDLTLGKCICVDRPTPSITALSFRSLKEYTLI
jgi:hypothetical protein